MRPAREEIKIPVRLKSKTFTDPPEHDQEITPRRQCPTLTKQVPGTTQHLCDKRPAACRKAARYSPDLHLLHRVFIGIFLLLTLALSISSAQLTAAEGYRYAGLEFFGSSQITRQEIESLLKLKPGAPLASIEKAAANLKRQLDAKRVSSNIQLVEAPSDQMFLVVDVSDASTFQTTPSRRLTNPHSVRVSDERPFLLLAQLHDRLFQLEEEGRPYSLKLKDGVRHYSDEPANLIIEDLLTLVPPIRKELFEIIGSDPNASRRDQSIELLEFGGSVPETAYELISALDDADYTVRARATRYIYPRLDLLPDDFPYDLLAAALARQICRPSHQDRSKGLHLLLALAARRPELVDPLHDSCLEKLKELTDKSRIDTVKDPSLKLLTIISRSAQTNPHTKEQLPADEFQGR